MAKKVSKEGKKRYIISTVSLIFSIVATIVTMLSFFSAEEKKPLSYYLKPNIINISSNSFQVEIEVIVSEGAIGDVRVVDYRDGEVVNVAKYRGGTIKSTSSKKERTFEYEVEHHEKTNEFLATAYFLVNGKDGSKDLSVCLFHVNLSNNSITTEYYNREDLVFAELDQNKKSYSNFLANYRKLFEVLKEKGEL